MSNCIHCGADGRLTDIDDKDCPGDDGVVRVGHTFEGASGWTTEWTRPSKLVPLNFDETASPWENDEDGYHWNYRVLNRPGTFTIIEAHYETDKDGNVKLVAWSENSEPVGDTLEELRDDLQAMLKALDIPAVTPADLRPRP